jgi:hypothetical protein
MDVRDVARGQSECDGTALSIGQGMDFAGRPTPRDADRFRPRRPFVVWAERWAFTWVRSNDSSSGTGPAAAMRSNMRCQTPRRDQRVKRL